MADAVMPEDDIARSTVGFNVGRLVDRCEHVIIAIGSFMLVLRVEFVIKL